MVVGILYIGTGKYSIFWKSFYESCEKHFVKNVQKKYFVFTDSEDIVDTEDITVIHQKPRGFPLDSLMRFDMFLSIKDMLAYCDYLFFFNSNMVFVTDVGEELLPKKEGLMGVLHPGYFDKEARFFPYERNPRSTAFIPYRKGKKYRYFMGGLNGGKTDDFIKLSEELDRNIKYDLERNLMAVYHDESQINAYFSDREVLVMDSSYGFPEDVPLPFGPKIMILNKIKHGGKYFDKLPKTSLKKRLMLNLRLLKNAVFWKKG